MRRLVPTAIISMLAAGFALSQVATTNAATITFVGTNQASQNRTSTFIQFIDSPPLLIITPVKTTTKTVNSRAWYDPGPPYVVSAMLPTVAVFVTENENVGGVTWAMGRSLSVPSIGSLNGYLVYWQYGDMSGNQSYWLGCNIVPVPHQCWRGVPDWLVSQSLSIKTDYSINPALPWMTWAYSGNSGTYQYTWW